MILTDDQIRKVAKLASLPIDNDEEALYSKQLSVVLDYIDQLDNVSTEGVEPTFNVSGNSNVMREDGISENLSQEEALRNAPSARDGFFMTKGVFEE